jgi:hypothetical protein
MGIRYTGAVPPKSKTRREVVRVTTAERQTFIVYSKAVYGQYIHYLNGRSVECMYDRGECLHCAKPSERRWKGYIDCWRVETSERVFLEFTRQCFDLIANAFDEGEELRGSRLRIWKTKGGAKGRYLVENLRYQRSDLDALPEGEDPIEILRFLWNCRTKQGQQA